ncbi:GAF domain-containing protein [Chitinimonas arctica]|uniref:GAF domain-containing protein n=1 Tax=Chitinimonas arctica TaxID=2594795 RepID=A0A516SCZ5_9NEIS|nr:GAF domain-containing protein [Chitinimonas arctica]QDQ26027.1 GAF domain-containing protein [Chitinimonas arctica]
MNPLDIEQIRACFDGGLPCQIASCSVDGVPDVCEIGQLHFVDAQHVALPYAHTGTLRRNLLVNPRLSACVTHPASAARFRLALEYQRTESEGPLFVGMRAKLAGSNGAIPLLGADICRVLAVEALPGPRLPLPPPPCNRLAAVRQLSQRLAAADELSQAFDLVLDGLAGQMGIDHALVLCVDESGKWLYTVASRGYAQSGVGSEVEIGRGLIGIAAQFRHPIRLASLTSDYGHAALQGGSVPMGGEIPFPTLHQPHSQLAVPIEAGNWLAGVLYVESAETRRFDFEDEDALVAVAQQLGLAMRWLTRPVEAPEPVPEPPSPPAAPPVGSPVTIRYFATSQSVFIDEDYLIKGVAGAVLWLLLNDHARDGRCESSNRALRLDPRLRLPDYDDNLDTRLLLLQRRLAERCDYLFLDKLGRGRIRLRVERPLRLVDGELTPAT